MYLRGEINLLTIKCKNNRTESIFFTINYGWTMTKCNSNQFCYSELFILIYKVILFIII